MTQSKIETFLHLSAFAVKKYLDPFMKRVFLCLFAVCSGIFSYAQTDTAMNYDSHVSDCIADFFENTERVPTLGKAKLIDKAGRLMTMTAFLTKYNIGAYSSHGLVDLDKDGKNELLISNFTGGAHCCDELYVFRNTGPDRYQYVVKLFAGNACVAQDYTISFRFYEQFGYFFSCYACAYTDTTDAAPIPMEIISLRYANGKISVVPGDKELRSTIIDNLGKLSEQPYEKLGDDISMDNGLRKEFALNLVVFYYSFGKNMVETQKLFNTFYKFPDAKVVWAEFVKHLQHVKKQNIF
jgi:hypothetical protein